MLSCHLPRYYRPLDKAISQSEVVGCYKYTVDIFKEKFGQLSPLGHLT